MGAGRFPWFFMFQIVVLISEEKKTSFYSQNFNFRWERVASLDQKRGGCGLVALNNCLYAIGSFLSPYFGIGNCPPSLSDLMSIINCSSQSIVSSHQKVALAQYTDAQVVTTATNPLRVLRGSTQGRTSKYQSFSNWSCSTFSCLRSSLIQLHI